MRRLIVATAFAGLVWAMPFSQAHADISKTQHLPTAACNQGTMNAHSQIPPVPGNGNNPNLSRFGNQTNGHNAVPGTANVTPCGYGG
jgi:hypothetical protein